MVSIIPSTSPVLNNPLALLPLVPTLTYSNGNRRVAGMTHARINRGQSLTREVCIPLNAEVNSGEVERGMAIWCVYCEYGSTFLEVDDVVLSERRLEISSSSSFSLECSAVDLGFVHLVIFLTRQFFVG